MQSTISNSHAKEKFGEVGEVGMKSTVDFFRGGGFRGGGEPELIFNVGLFQDSVDEAA